MAIYKYDYNKISNNNEDYLNENGFEINTYCPTPSDIDYKNGFIVRYFAQKTNDKSGYIYELNETSNLALSFNPFYTTISIRWKISGTDDEIKESNFKSVQIGMKKIPLLIKYLPNYLQFAIPKTSLDSDNSPKDVGSDILKRKGFKTTRTTTNAPTTAAPTTTTTTAAPTTTTTTAAPTTTTTTAAPTTTTTTAAPTTTTTTAAPTTTTTTTAAPTTTTTTAAPTTTTTTTTTTAAPTTTTTTTTTTAAPTTTTTTTTAAPTTYTVTANGSSNYVINGNSNPTLNLIEGETYTFNVNASGHPFYIKTTSSTGTGNAYNSGVTNNGTDNGTITFVVPSGAPSTLYYNCQFHIGMAGTINIT